MLPGKVSSVRRSVGGVDLPDRSSEGRIQLDDDLAGAQSPPVRKQPARDSRRPTALAGRAPGQAPPSRLAIAGMLETFSFPHKSPSTY